jgi:hypothetical protein
VAGAFSTLPRWLAMRIDRRTRGNVHDDVGDREREEEKEKQSTSVTVVLKPPHSSIFLFQNYSQFHMETSKTCNMKVAQN